MAMTGGTAQLVKSTYANYGSSSVSINLYVYYKSVQNTDKNQSTITVGMYVQTSSDTYQIGGWDDYNGSYVGTTSNTFNGSFSKFGGTKWLTENQTFIVNHNSDGTGSATIYWKWGVNSPWGGYVNPSGSFSISLPTIPRASSITSASNVTLGNTCNIQWTPASTNYYYKINFAGGTAATYTTAAIQPKSTSAYNYTGYRMTVGDWAPHITTSSTATCTATLYTYSDSGCTKQVGSATTKTFTLTIPSDVKPSITSITATYGNDDFSKNNNIYVQNHSSALLTINGGKGIYGSSIVKYYITGGFTYTSTTCPTNKSTGLITSSGTKTFYAQVEDSRGRLSDKVSVSINVLPYAAPTIKLTAARQSDPNQVSITYNITFSSLNNKNSIKLFEIYKRQSGVGTFSNVSTVDLSASTSGNCQGARLLTGFDSDKSYDFQIKVQDTAYSTNGESNIITIGTASRLVNINVNNNSVAIGKISEGTSKFECALASEFDGVALFNDNATFNKPLITTGGSLVHSALGVIGVAGYVKIATITIKGTYANQPFSFCFARRKDSATTICNVQFSSVNSVDPDVISLCVMQQGTPVYIRKTATSKWDIYIQKSEAYDSIDVISYNIGSYMLDRIELTWTNELITTLPEGCKTATKLLDAQYATLDHTHTPASIGAATSGHNHNNTYAALGHTHKLSYTLLLDATSLANNASTTFTDTVGHSIYIVCSCVGSATVWDTTVVHYPAYSSTSINVQATSDNYPFRLSNSGTTYTIKREGTASVKYRVYGVDVVNS